MNAARAASERTRTGPRAWCGRLASLARRRIAPLPRVLAWALVAGWLASRDWTPSDWIGEAQGAALSRGLAREAAWRTGSALLLPLAAWQGAQTFARWRRGEGDYVGASPAAPLALVVSSLGGLLAGIALLVLAGGAAVELALGVPRGPALQLVWSRSVPDPPRVEPGGRLEVRLAAPPLAGEGRVRARLRPTFGASPTTFVDLGVRREESEGAAGRGASEALLAGAPLVAPSWLEVAAPAGAGALVWSLHDTGEGPLALDGTGTFEIWEPVRAETAAAAVMGLRLWLALAAAAALAFAFAAWVSPMTAAAGAGAVLLATVALPGVCPAAGLAAAFEHLALGRVPALAPRAAWLGCGAALGLALLLAGRGTRDWGGGR